MSSDPHRLAPIEGLRAYLAFWVLVCHALWAAGYEVDTLPAVGKLLRHGEYAVDVFVIVSGFVIFLLLDGRRETFGQFIVRRFFRLFPLSMVLFFVAIPLSWLALWNLAHGGQYLTPDHVARVTSQIASWWQNIRWNILFHTFLIQGVIPECVLAGSPGAFLEPAWSISLEWQFYLVAPLAYALAVSARPWHRFCLCVASVLFFGLGGRISQYVMYGAALPCHLEFFFIGAASYFFWKRRPQEAAPEIWFPVSCALAYFLFMLDGPSHTAVPLAIWIAFLGLLMERPDSASFRLVSPLFNNRFIQFMGRVSFSIYLSHMLLLILAQHAILRWAPQLSRPAHLGCLLVATAAATIVVSPVLYRLIEAPGIDVGRRLASNLAGQSTSPWRTRLRDLVGGLGVKPALGSPVSPFTPERQEES